MHEPTRYRLPDTRKSVTRRVEHTQNLDIYVTVGFFEPQERHDMHEPLTQPGEVFVKIGKEGSTLQGLVDLSAVLMSLMLQYNIPWARIARKIRHTNFEPLNMEGKSVAHAVVTAVDDILRQKQSVPELGCC